VVSLLTPEEDAHFELSKEAQTCAANDIKFFGFPIPDRGVPASLSDFAILISDVRELLKSGRNVAVHCRQGIGRSGMLAASLLAESGLEPQGAIENVSAARGVPVPETPEQTQWVLTLPAHASSAAHRTRI
jgi:protein-tyrosine phosphatase